MNDLSAKRIKEKVSNHIEMKRKTGKKERKSHHRKEEENKRHSNTKNWRQCIPSFNNVENRSK